MPGGSMTTAWMRWSCLVDAGRRGRDFPSTRVGSRRSRPMDAERVFDVGLHRSFAHGVVPRAIRNGGLEARAKVPCRYAVGKGRDGRLPAADADQFVECVLGDVGLDPRRINDLMAARTLALSLKRLPTVQARAGLDDHHAVHLLRRDGLAPVRCVAELGARLAARGGFGTRRRGGGAVRGGRAGGIARMPAKRHLEALDLFAKPVDLEQKLARAPIARSMVTRAEIKGNITHLPGSGRTANQVKRSPDSHANGAQVPLSTGRYSEPTR